MTRYFVVSIYLLCSLLQGALISPINNKEITYIHVLFEWEQEPGAIEYVINISESPDLSSSIQASTAALIHIQDSGLGWNTTYYWNVVSYDSQGLEISSSETNQFTIGAPISSVETNVFLPNQYADGITIFGSFFDYNSIALDMDGNEIWHDDSNSIVYYNTDYYGQLFGCQQDASLEHDLPAVEFNLDSDVLWMDPNDEFAHHDMIQLPNGNYMGLIEDVSLGHIPGDYIAAVNYPYYQFMCILSGYQCDGITNEFNWIGDRIVEWDAQTKEVVWDWSVHDYFSKEDYDEGLWASIQTGDAAYDWTHVNALTYNDEDNAIYISTRHLSRITKIDYDTKEIVWNIGLDMPSGDVGCGHDLNFSWQHSVTLTDEGTIVTLDNGNQSPDLYGTDYQTTRGLEIIVSELGDQSCSAEIGWEYSLPEELFGFATGNAQKLDNGNYLITTVGDGGTSQEVSNGKEIVWEAKYNLDFPTGAVHRANRISSLYPVAYSVVRPDFTIDEGLEVVSVDGYSDELSFTIYNNGSVDETFNYSVSDTRGWVSDISGSLLVQASSFETINYAISPNPFDESSDMTIFISPEHRSDLEKEYTSKYTIDSVDGCTSSDACNYDSYATNNDGSCEFAEENFNCFGNCIAETDCAGVCGGNAQLDVCGVCNGGSEDELDCDCSDGSEKDCNGLCASDGSQYGSTLDECNVCGGTGPEENFDCQGNCIAVVDCLGACGGDAAIDQCGVCAGEDLSCSGCTNENYLEYDPNATIDDGSCITLSFDSNLIPLRYKLLPSYPNPFNPSTTFQFQVPNTSKIVVGIYNINGQKVKNITNSMFAPGTYALSWDGKNDQKEDVPSGLYFIIMNAPNFRSSNQIVLLK